MSEEKKIPFKFLDSYTYADRELFYGRDKEVNEIYRKFFSHNLFIVYGKSGTGKSSLINCGLMAKIPKEDCLLIPVRCGIDPLQNFIIELKKYTDSTSNNEIELIESIYENHFKPIAIMFDQFEEIFILPTANKRIRFINALKHILEIKVKTNVVIVIREEYLANLTEIEKEIPTLFNNRIRITNIDSATIIKDLIEQPCLKCNIAIEPGLTDKIVKKLTKNSTSIELPLFQILMDNLYNKAYERDNAKPELRISDLEELGDIENILADFLNIELTKFKEVTEINCILKAMVTHEGTKNQITFEDLLKKTKIEKNLAKTLLQELINKRIVSERNDKGLYEMKHECIAKRIYDRMSSEEKMGAEIKHMLINRHKDFKHTKTYLDQDTLKYVEPYLGSIKLPREVILFIKKSQMKQQAKSNTKIFTIAAFIIIPIVVVLWIMISQINEQKSQLETYIKEKADASFQKIKTDFSFVKGGTFYFGLQPNSSKLDSSKKVFVSDFFISKHEVSVENYKLYCKETNHAMPIMPEWGWADDYPIVNVNWVDANNYCAWLSQRTGEVYRLPTEAEYEFASKGGLKSNKYIYSGGNEPSNVSVYNSYQPSIIGSREPNELGIYDLSGNVREWCYDWYDTLISAKINTVNPMGPANPINNNKYKVVRGGAFSSTEESIKVTSRYKGRMDAVSDKNKKGLEHFGFRCVRVEKR